MGRKTNYSFERNQRAKDKAAKREAKREARRAAKEQHKDQTLDDSPVGPPSPDTAEER